MMTYIESCCVVTVVLCLYQFVQFSMSSDDEAVDQLISPSVSPPPSETLEEKSTSSSSKPSLTRPTSSSIKYHAPIKVTPKSLTAGTWDPLLHPLQQTPSTATQQTHTGTLNQHNKQIEPKAELEDGEIQVSSSLSSSSSSSSRPPLAPVSSSLTVSTQSSNNTNNSHSVPVLTQSSSESNLHLLTSTTAAASAAQHNYPLSPTVTSSSSVNSSILSASPVSVSSASSSSRSGWFSSFSSTSTAVRDLELLTPPTPMFPDYFPELAAYLYALQQHLPAASAALIASFSSTSPCFSSAALDAISATSTAQTALSELDSRRKAASLYVQQSNPKKKAARLSKQVVTLENYVTENKYAIVKAQRSVIVLMIVYVILLIVCARGCV